MTLTPTVFAQGKIPATVLASGSQSTNVMTGENLRTVITSSINSYPYPGATAKTPTRTDCAGATCTYAEEMANYATWWAYYHTRILMMKTAASVAFSTLDTAADVANGVSRFRVGFMTINNNNGNDFLNVNEFKTTQKQSFYQRFLGVTANNSTPLREALSHAGQMYAGILNGTTLNGTTVTDPLQFSCQRNYTILSTDGFWNGSTGYTLASNGIGTMASPDSSLPRPYWDGGSAIVQQQTSNLQKRTKASSSSSWTAWSNASSCTTVSSGYPQTQCQYTAYSSWSNVGSCVPVAKSPSSPYTVGTAVNCQSVVTGGTANTLADVAAYYYITDLRDPTNSQTGTCTGPVVPPATTANDLCANNVPQGQFGDTANTQHMTVFTMGLGAQGYMVYSPTYLTDVSGDYYSVANGLNANPTNGVCTWQTAGTACVWPAPAHDQPTAVDDLWHAAVNGRGMYFSATDPSSLATSLGSILTTINNVPRPGTAAAAATSNPNVSSADNFVFSSFYESVQWYGELVLQTIDPSTGSLSNNQWSAMTLLDCGLTPWAPTTTYIVNSVFNNGGQCYVVTNQYTSSSTFGSTDTANTTVVQNVAGSGPAAVPFNNAGFTSRVIYFNSAGALMPFTWANLSAAQKANFQAPTLTYTVTNNTTIPVTYTGLTQFCASGPNCLNSTQQNNSTIATGGAAGEAMINYLRGDRSNEGSLYRARAHVLGDIVSSEAAYVKAPLFSYADTGYLGTGGFQQSNASRASRVYVGGNDGMLHAFDATSGQEVWAYVPTQVIPNLYKLADTNYSNVHQYYVDGSPVVGDITKTPGGTAWRTIVVGGLNAGGAGYYALDVTDPTQPPTLLWEFTDPNLGYSFSNPVITKTGDGRWVVAIASGYNNTSGGGDGHGHLWVIDAYNGPGTYKHRFDTPDQGGTTSPSGLARIVGHAVTSQTDNTACAVYGGDLFGNLWRFDISDPIGATNTKCPVTGDTNGVALIAKLPGPITTKPIVTTVVGTSTKQNHVVLYVGTGEYLGVSDVPTTTMNSFYAIKDPGVDPVVANPTAYGDPHGDALFIKQSMTLGTCPSGAPTSVCTPGQSVLNGTGTTPVDFDVDHGWLVDFLTAGERSSTDPQLGLGTVLFTTIIPNSASSSACAAAAGTGGSNVYALNYLNGQAVAGAGGVVGTSLGTGIATRPVMVRLSDGSVVALIRMSAVGVTSGGQVASPPTDVIKPPISASGGGSIRRVSWRELNGQ